MSDIYKGELQDDLGNTVYPHTESDVVFCTDGETAQEKLAKYENALGSVTGKSGSLEIGDPNVLATTEATKKLNESLNNIGTMKTSISYSGDIEANSFCPNALDLPKGKWLVTTSGYVALSGQYQPFGLGDNGGYVVKGFNPSLLLDLNNAKRLYIWSLYGETIQALDLVINAIKVG